MRIGATNEIEADFEELLRLAVTEALWSAEMVPADAVKLPVVEPVPTLTDAGMVRVDGALLESATEVVAPGALESVTTHVVEVF
jgi:hypothetical protein